MKKVYLKDDSDIVNNKYNCIIISNKVSSFYQVSGKTEAVAPTVSSLLEQKYNGSIQLFFDYLKTIDEKFFIYCDKLAFEELQITFLKSIYGKDRLDTVRLVYDTYMDMVNAKIDIWRQGKNVVENQVPERDWNRLDPTMFKAKYQLAMEVQGINPEEIGTEYLLPYLYQDGHPLQQIFLDKAKWMIKRKIYREYIDIKETMLRHGYLLSAVPEFEHIDLTPGNFKKSILHDKKLKWLMDDRFTLSNIEYCINTYNIDDLHPIFSFVVGLEGNYFGNDEDTYNLVNKNDDRAVANDLKKGNQGILINAYTDSRLNTYLISYFIMFIINGQKEELTKFLLKE